MAPTTTISLRRFKRRKTDLKLELVECLGQLNSCTSKQAAEFIRDRAPTKDDKRSVNASFKYLLDDAKHQYITRKRMVQGFLYGLTESGAALARERGVETARRFDLRDFEHENLVTEIILAYKEFARAHGFTFRFRRDPIDHKRKINPDVLIYLGTERGEYCIAVEVERQHYGESYVKKAEKYKNAFDTDEAKRQFGVRKFRVQFFVETFRRRDFALRQFALDYPNRMFWLATFEDVNNIGGKVFLTPKDFDTARWALLDVIQ